MVNAASGNYYMKNVGGLYNYSYNTMRSASSQYNTAEINKTPKRSYINNDALKYVANVQANAKNMLESLGTLANKDTFSKMQAVSANDESLAISQKSNVDPGFKYMQVNVKQTAAGQINEGSQLAADTRFESDTGIKQFELEQGGKRYQFSISVRGGDTNDAVQQKMADAINARNIGVTADVSRDGKTGTSTLTIESKNTGADNKSAFAVRDVSGDVVAKTGAGNITQQARDAIYSVNGGANRVSPTNDVNLGEGVAASFNKTSGGPVGITAQRDTGDAVNAVTDLVKSFNELVSAAQNSSKEAGIQNDLLSAAKTYAPALERIGITSNQDNTLSVDYDALNRAAENGGLEQFLTQAPDSANYGFTNRLAQIAQRVDYNNSSAGVQNADVNTRNNAQTAVNSYRHSMNNYNYLYNYMFGSGASAGMLFNIYA